MKYYDLFVKYNDDIDEIIDRAIYLGIEGIAASYFYNNKEEFDKYLEEIQGKREDVDIDLVTSSTIEPDNKKQMKRLLGKVRQKVEIVSVYGGDLEVNRAAAEDSRVDILLHPEYQRKDAGIDHKIAKFASENNVAIALVFHQLLNTYGKTRVHLFQHMRKIIGICKKYDAPLLFVTGARDCHDLRNIRQLYSVLKTFELKSDTINKMLYDWPAEIVDRNRNKLNDTIVKEGVKKL